MVGCVMDPWSSEEAPVPEADLNTFQNKAKAEFEDHFVDIIPTSEESVTVVAAPTKSAAFEKLPDSQDYLASLEKKLKAVQTGTRSQQRNKPQSSNLIQSLEETRESYMVNLLTSANINSGVATGAGDEFTSADELSVNPILKKLAPEKQALTTEELIELLKADQLSLLQQQQNEGEAQTETDAKSTTPALPSKEERDDQNQS